MDSQGFHLHADDPRDVRLTVSVQVREFGAGDEQPGVPGCRGKPGCQAADPQWTSQREGDQSPAGQTQHQVIKLGLSGI